jgi:putative phage-type endonuclease
VVLPSGAPEEEWHAMRATGLGGSDIAAIVGLDKYRSPLEVWLAKTGQFVPRREDEVLDEAALMGHLLEPIVAQRFQAKTGLPVLTRPGTLRAAAPTWALANLDGATVEDGEPGVFEAKTRSSYALDDWIDEPPAGPYLQVQDYLMVTGWAFGYIACLIGGQRTIVHRIERDEAVIDDLAAIGDDFWQCVTDRRRPPIDGSQATAELLGRLHAHPDDDAVVIGDAAEVEQLLRARAKAAAQAQAASAEVTAAENRMKEIAGDATEVHARGELAYSWRRRRGQISWKAAALDLEPDLDPEPYRGPDTRVLRVHLEDL